MLHRSLPPSFLPFLSQIVPIIVPFDDFRRCKFTASRELSGNFKSTISTIVQLVNKFRLDNERSIAFLNSNYIYIYRSNCYCNNTNLLPEQEYHAYLYSKEEKKRKNWRSNKGEKWDKISRNILSRRKIPIFLSIHPLLPSAKLTTLLRIMEEKKKKRKKRYERVKELNCFIYGWTGCRDCRVIGWSKERMVDRRKSCVTP